MTTWHDRINDPRGNDDPYTTPDLYLGKLRDGVRPIIKDATNQAVAVVSYRGKGAHFGVERWRMEQVDGTIISHTTYNSAERAMQQYAGIVNASC